MQREPDMDSAAYRDKKLYEKYKQINNPKKPTEGDLLGESGEYTQDPEQEDLSQQVNYSEQIDIESLTNRQKQQQDAKKWGSFDEAVAGAKSPEDLIKAGKIRKRIEEAEDEIDPETGWPMYLAKGAWWAMQKVGEGFDWVDDQAGIPGTDIDVYHARRKILDPLSETHFALGILGEILLPDSIDIATAGASYIPNRFRKAGKAGIKLWAKLQKANKGTEAFDAAKVDWDKGLEFAAKAEGRPYEKFLNEEGIVHAISTDPLGTPRKKPESLIRSELGSQLGFTRQTDGQFVFSWNKLSEQSRKLGNASYWRRKGATYFTSPPNKADFTKYREANINAFMDEWEPFLKLDPMYESRKQFKRYIELHHITPLTISAPLFDNLARDSNEYQQLFDLLKKNFLTPGDMESNFFLTLKRPHQLLHDKFYVDTIGKQGEKFFTPARMELLNSGPDGRLAVAEEYIKTIKDGEGIIKDAMNYLSLVYRTNKKIPPEELVEQLTKLPYSPKYRLRDMDRMVREIIEQYDVKKTLFKPKPKKKSKQDLSKISQRERMTKDADIENELRGMIRQKRRNKKKPNDPDQGKLDI